MLPEDYAKKQLKSIEAPLKKALLEALDLRCYGEKLMAEKGVVQSEYGMLIPDDGITLQEKMEPIQSHGMTMA